MPIRPLILAVLSMLLFACGDAALDLNLQLPSANGLQPGSPVVAGNQTVGQVTAVEPNPSGGFIAKLAIQGAARNQATQDARFVVARDPADPNQRRVELRPGQPGTPALADGATVNGAVESGPLFQLGEMIRGFTEGLSTLRGQVEQFRTEMQRLPQSPEARQLAGEWQRLQEELVQAQQTTEETVKKDLLPKLQREMDALQKRLREMEVAAKAKPL
jgi:cell fate (sporulation/competence/biofilm development) regulator YlbF (YheA/YmcA/DUF963 family)